MLWVSLVLAFVALLLVLRRLVRTGGAFLTGLPHATIHRGSGRGRLMVVTGSTSGIGFEVAKGLAMSGATVILAAMTRQMGEDAKERLCKLAMDAVVEVYVLDLRSEDSIKEFVETALRSRKVDVLAHVAGVCGHVPTMVRVNFVGPCQLISLVLPHMNTKNGRIVCVGSDAHQLGDVRMDDFVLSKRWRALKPSVSTILPVQHAYG